MLYLFQQRWLLEIFFITITLITFSPLLGFITVSSRLVFVFCRPFMFKRNMHPFLFMITATVRDAALSQQVLYPELNPDVTKSVCFGEDGLACFI